MIIWNKLKLTKSNKIKQSKNNYCRTYNDSKKSEKVRDGVSLDDDGNVTIGVV